MVSVLPVTIMLILIGIIPDYSDLPVITGDTSLNLQGEYKDLENAIGNACGCFKW